MCLFTGSKFPKIGKSTLTSPMAKHSKSLSWYGQHKSAVLIFALFIIGFVLVILGILVEAGHAQYEQFLGKLLVELSIASFVGGIATLFLSLPDVRHQLTSVLATLFSEGEIAGLLSVTARQLLNKKLLRYRLGSEVSKIDEDLFGGLTDLTDECLRSVHLQDYHLVTSFKPHPTDPALLYQRNVINFRINIAHLLSETPRPVKFPFKVGYEIDLPLGTTISDKDFLPEFKLRVGEVVYTEAKIITIEDGEVRAIRFEFDAEFELNCENTAVELKYRAAQLKSDNISSWRARYPTRGLQTSISYSNDFEYGCKWFTSIGAEGTFALLDTGITATRDDWILPNEGVVIFWTPKQDAPASSSAG
jgi:hypothetical protein